MSDRDLLLKEDDAERTTDVEEGRESYPLIEDDAEHTTDVEEGKEDDVLKEDDTEGKEESCEEQPAYNLLQSQIEKYIVSEHRAEDWVPIKADIYQMWAVGWEGTSCSRSMKIDDFLKVLGLYMIPIVQVIGPAAIMMWAIYNLDWSEAKITSPFRYEFGSKEHGISRVTTQALSTIFLFLFPLYGVATLHQDDETLLKLRLMFFHMRSGDEKVPRSTQLILNVIGPIINSWVVLLSSINMLLLFFYTDSPKDLLYDSLGLLFLFNLDDSPGQVDALFPEWPAQTVGNVYWKRVYAVWSGQRSLAEGEQAQIEPFAFKDSEDNYEGWASPDEIMNNIQDIEARYAEWGIGRNWIYRVTRWVLRPLVIVLPVTYLLLCETVVAIEE